MKYGNPRPKSTWRTRAEDLVPAVEALKVDLDTVKTNEPINRKRGDTAQAELERATARSYEAAIKYLSER